MQQLSSSLCTLASTVFNRTALSTYPHPEPKLVPECQVNYTIPFGTLPAEVCDLYDYGKSNWIGWFIFTHPTFHATTRLSAEYINWFLNYSSLNARSWSTIVPNSDLPISNSIWTVWTYINGREILFLTSSHASPDPKKNKSQAKIDKLWLVKIIVQELFPNSEEPPTRTSRI